MYARLAGLVPSRMRSCMHMRRAGWLTRVCTAGCYQPDQPWHQWLL